MLGAMNKEDPSLSFEVCMRFCRNFVSDVSFEPQGLQPCCNIRGIAIPCFPYDGGPIDMQRYHAHIAETILRVQEEPVPLCATCPDLLNDVEITGNIHDVRCMFHSVSLNHHRNLCNCKCQYCEQWKSPRRGKPYSVVAGLQSLHEQGALFKQCFMSWGGGESTLLSDFVVSSQWIARNGYFQHIHTNALRHSPWVEELLAQGLCSVMVSVDSGTSELYKKIKGVDGFGRVVSTLGKYVGKAKNTNHVAVKYLILDENSHEAAIDAFFKLCVQLGVTNVQYSFEMGHVFTSAVSEKMIAAGVRFRHWCTVLGIAAVPFFVEDALLQRLERAEADLGQPTAS